MPIHAPFGGVFGSHFPQMMSLIVLTRKRTVLGWNYVIWAINRENRSRGSSWALEREKKDRKKLQIGYISPIWGEAPTEAMYIKICLVGDVPDVITCTKFENEILRGYDFTGGRIFHFSYWFFWMGLTTVQRATALPVMSCSSVNRVILMEAGGFY